MGFQKPDKTRQLKKGMKVWINFSILKNYIKIPNVHDLEKMS